MVKPVGSWTTLGLYEKLIRESLFASNRARIEIIDGLDPSLRIIMYEFGDLPMYLTVVGGQIIVEAVLWSVEDVHDIHGFNVAILKTHKYFPLSTISLERVPEGPDHYHMFGALSASSMVENIVFEIEVLASNVIQASEAYAEFLVAPDGAQGVK